MRTHSSEATAILHAFTTLGAEKWYRGNEIVEFAAAIYAPPRGGVTPKQSLRATLTRMYASNSKWGAIAGLVETRFVRGKMQVRLK